VRRLVPVPEGEAAPAPRRAPFPLALEMAEHSVDNASSREAGSKAFSLLLEMAEHSVDNASSLLTPLLAVEPYLGSLLSTSRTLAAHAPTSRALAEAELSRALRLGDTWPDAACLARLRHVDWSGCELSTAQWWHVGWMLLPGKPIGHVQTVTTGSYAMPFGEWRGAYGAARASLFARTPPPLVLAAAGLCAPDLAALFSYAAGGGMANLREIDISDDAVSDGSLALLGRAVGRGGMANLWSLSLARCGVTSAGAAALAAALAAPDEAGRPTLPRLMYLHLMGNAIGDAGAAALAAALESSRAAASLCVLDLGGNPAAAEGAERLAAACARRDVAFHCDFHGERRRLPP
jgi:hypothetical protein